MAEKITAVKAGYLTLTIYAWLCLLDVKYNKAFLKKRILHE